VADSSEMRSKFPGRPAEEFDFQEILYEKKDYVATVTINRPKAYNAYSSLTLEEMAKAFLDCMWDDEVAVVVLTGAGDKAFCTGGDVKEYAEYYTRRPEDFWKWSFLFENAHNIYRGMGKPTIARINGMVAGGGNEWNLASDLAVMADHATIRQVGTQVGSVAAGGATQWLPLVVGDRRAREILFTCDPVDAAKCLDWGLVNRVVPYAELDDAVAELAGKLVDKMGDCMRMTKQQSNFMKDFLWSVTWPHAKDWLSVHFANLEPQEAMWAFVEKRKPDYGMLRDRLASGQSNSLPWGPYRTTCPSCGSRHIPEGFAYCGHCGTRLEEEGQE